MNGLTRRSVLAGLAVSLSTAGCLSGSDERTGADGTTTRRSTDAATTGRTARTTERTTATTEETTTELDFWSRAAKEPRADHSVIVRNDADEEQAVRTRVVREETGETVFDETREIPAGEDVRLYNLARADPDGIEPFRVCGALAESVSGETTAEPETPGATSDCVTLRTNACYGNAYLSVPEVGSLGVTYSIC